MSRKKSCLTLRFEQWWLLQNNQQAHASRVVFGLCGGKLMHSFRAVESLLLEPKKCEGAPSSQKHHQWYTLHAIYEKVAGTFSSGVPH